MQEKHQDSPTSPPAARATGCLLHPGHGLRLQPLLQLPVIVPVLLHSPKRTEGVLDQLEGVRVDQHLTAICNLADMTWGVGSK
jgi:hypothetical protein